MSAVGRLVREALGGESLPRYHAALADAFRRAPPPYAGRSFGEGFRRRARDGSWFAALLVSNANLEGYSGRQLWHYAQAIDDPQLAEGMRAHARDEVSHAKLFARLLFLVFPALETPERRAELAALAPDLGSLPSAVQAPWTFEELLNSVILINLHEVKALVLERLLAPLLQAWAPVEAQERVGRLVSRLLADEVEHIRYTACFMERAASDGWGDYVREACCDFQVEVNRVTLEELSLQPNGGGLERLCREGGEALERPPGSGSLCTV